MKRTSSMREHRASLLDCEPARAARAGRGAAGARARLRRAVRAAVSLRDGRPPGADRASAGRADGHLHVEFYPPLRTAEKLKYLAGSEQGAGTFISDALPEESAADAARGDRPWRLSARRAFAPGRVNLIGEHTDYNGGLALPFAIAAGRHRSRARAIATTQRIDAHARRPRRATTSSRWRDRAPRRGLARVRARHRRRAERARARSLPGATPARSAATCRAAPACPPRPRSRSRCAWRCSSSAASRTSPRSADWPATRPARDRAAVRARGERVGRRADRAARPARVAVRRARHGAADRLPHARDRARAAAARRLAAGRARLRRAPRARRARGYNERRAECARACELLGVASLRDAERRATLARLPEPLRRRARHVLERERARARRRRGAARRATCPRSARLLNASHASLRDLYEVSTPAVEATVERLLRRRRGGRAHGRRRLRRQRARAVRPRRASRPPRRIEVRPARRARAPRRRCSRRAAERAVARSQPRGEQRAGGQRRSPATAPRARRRAARAAAPATAVRCVRRCSVRTPSTRSVRRRSSRAGELSRRWATLIASAAGGDQHARQRDPQRVDEVAGERREGAPAEREPEVAVEAPAGQLEVVGGQEQRRPSTTSGASQRARR